MKFFLSLIGMYALDLISQPPHPRFLTWINMIKDSYVEIINKYRLSESLYLLLNISDLYAVDHKRGLCALTLYDR